MMNNPKYNLTDTLYTTKTCGTLGIDLEVKLYICFVTGIRIDINTPNKHWVYTVKMYDITDNPQKIEFKKDTCEHDEISEECLYGCIVDALTAHSMMFHKKCNEQIAMLKETMKDVDEQLEIINGKY